MFKKTLLFSHPAYLSTRDAQMLITYPGQERAAITQPIEDIGIVVIENGRITLTAQLMERLMANNVAIVTCDDKHMPSGISLPLNGNSEMQKRLRYQLDASLPLRKQLWQQTVQAKIANQAAVLEALDIPAQKMQYWGRQVQSGDALNHEARAAAYYWPRVFQDPTFIRGRESGGVNPWLNYGYAILRAVCARALVGAGLLPARGIHHENKYNPFCLADDVMEPYRPFVDAEVVALLRQYPSRPELSIEIKQHLLRIPYIDVSIKGQTSPLMHGVNKSVLSLWRCYKGELRRLHYPEYGKGK